MEDHTTEAIPTKQCKMCDAVKPLTDFATCKRTSDGREGKCRKCRARQRKIAPPAPPPEGHKRCNRCKQDKPAALDFFGKDKSRRDGFSRTCKVCRAETQKQLFYTYQPPDDPACVPLRRCPKCLMEYPRTPEHFYRNRTVADGLCTYCKSCDIASALNFNTGEKARARKARWRKKNPEYHGHYFKTHAAQIIEHHRGYRARTRQKQKEYTKRYRDKNPWVGRAAKLRRRALENMRPSDLSTEQWQAAISYFDGVCAACGRPPGLFHTLAMDHWVPLSTPDCPGTVPENIIPLCHGTDGCNNSKHNKPAAEWLAAKFGKRKGAAILARIEAYFATVRQHA